MLETRSCWRTLQDINKEGFWKQPCRVAASPSARGRELLVQIPEASLSYAQEGQEEEG